MLVEQFISDITNQSKQFTMDSFISPKFIYSEAVSIIGDFLKKDQDAKRKLFKVSDGWSELQCLELEEIPVIDCPEIDVRICEKLMKSKQRLPETYSYSFGNIIKHVASINFSTFYDPVTPRQWSAIQKREFKNPNKYYYFFLDGYLYIPIPKKQSIAVESVRIDAYFISKWEVAQFNVNNPDCKECKGDACKSPLEYDLVIPNYLINDVKKELLSRLYNMFLRSPVDAYPNLNPNDVSGQRDIQNSRNG